jgi:hypothetical protein
MSIESVSKCELLAEKIVSLLSKGIYLDSGVIHYIDSTLGRPTLQELEAVITDKNNCERDSLLELIFYPDETIQAQLEPVLASQTFTREDIKKVGARLSTFKPNIVLLWPHGERFLKLPLPGSVINNFVDRLNICTRTDFRIIEAIDIGVRASDKALVKVKLRNRRFYETDNKSSFLCKFFKSNLTENLYFFTCLDFIIEFFNGLKNDNDIFNSMAQKKILYSSLIKKAADLTEQLNKKNFEILMAGNVRIPYLDVAEYKRQIEIIDLIASLQYEL